MQTEDAHRVLIVDDSPTNRRILVAALAKSGYVTLEAGDGIEALAKTRTEHPDLILLDVLMPELDGFEVCLALKADASTASIPVIFLTALSEAHVTERAFAVGASDFVVKPFNLGEVKARVSVHLQLRRARKELHATHAQLLKAQRLEAIGQLAAGVAHEINTPLQYVADNIHFLRDSVPVLFELARELSVLVDDAPARMSSEHVDALRMRIRDADLTFLTEEVPRAIQQSMEGTQHIATIVRAMKAFAHPGVQDKVLVDINHAIETVLTLGRNEWKYVAAVETVFDPDLPQVQCFAGETNQVFLNILVNAAHAIGDVVGDTPVEKGKIRVITKQAGEHVEIRISDTGSGIAQQNLARIFDPFFTTKAVGKGTGQGLAIAHAVIVDKHGGTIDVESTVGKGTTFIIRLPIGQPHEAAQPEPAERAA